MANLLPDKEPSCINCGGAGHWAFACPEPTRQVPAGLHTKRPADERHRGGGKHGAKRHKGPIVNKYSPPVPAALHWSHPPPPFAPPYGGYSHPDPSYPPPTYAPHGHFGGPAPPPGPPPSYSPPPHLAGRGPYNGPPHGHPHSPPRTYAGPPSGLPPAPAPYGQPVQPPPLQPLPQPHADWQQHQYQQQYHPHQHQSHEHHHHHHQYPQAHPPPPPPAHYGYSAPQTHPLPQHPYVPIPPPPSRSPNTGHSFHGRLPSTHPPPGGPPYSSHTMPERGNHHSPPPPLQRVVTHGYPPTLPTPPNIGGPGSLIRILSPKSVAQLPPEARAQGRRKDRNKTWKNKRNKEKQASSTTAANGEPKKRNEPKPGSETTKPPKPEKSESCEKEKPTISSDTEGEKGLAEESSGKAMGATPGASDKPEEGEIVDEDSDWTWDENTIFQEPEKGHPADAVAGPLPAEYTEHVLIPPAWNSKCITSVFVGADNRDEFCRSVRETPLWDRYKSTVPFDSSGSTANPPLSSANLLRLLDTRRSSHDPGRRREPKAPSPKQSPKAAEDWDRAPSYERPVSPDKHEEQRDRRPAIDSYRPNYQRDRPSRSRSRGGKRGRGDDAPPPSRGRGSPSSRAPYYQPHLDDRSRDSSPESDLNSLENELLGLSPKSPSGDEKDKVDEKKAEESKKRQGDDVIPKSKRRRVQVDSAFSRRW